MDIDNLVRNRMKASRLILEDGLHALLTGTGSPFPDLERANPSVAVQAGEKRFVVDAGSGSARNLQASGFHAGKIDAVFITHFHSDHIGGLGDLMFLRWTMDGNSRQLPVYGPTGTCSVVEGFRMAYAQDTRFRVAHHGEKVLPPGGAGGKAVEFDLGKDPMASEIIYDKGGVKVTAFNVDHAPVFPAVGYKFEYKDRSLVISGDTVYTENLVKHSKDTDLLICDVMNKELVDIINKNSDLSPGKNTKNITADIKSYHMSQAEAVITASKANISYLVLTHIVPPLPAPILENTLLFLGEEKKNFNGKIDFGRDGMLISMPAKRRQEIITKYLFNR